MSGDGSPRNCENRVRQRSPRLPSRPFRDATKSHVGQAFSIAGGSIDPPTAEKVGSTVVTEFLGAVKRGSVLLVGAAQAVPTGADGPPVWMMGLCGADPPAAQDRAGGIGCSDPGVGEVAIFAGRDLTQSRLYGNIAIWS